VSRNASRDSGDKEITDRLRGIVLYREEVLGSKQESLNKRIRETISRLSDEDLVNLLRASPQTHTPFARQVAEEEVARRRELKATSGARDADPAALRKEAARDKRADCYIEVWSDKNFEGEYMRIEGPVECGALEFASSDWGDTISSLRVGPTAFVLVYADKGFKGTMMSFGPSQEVSNLEKLNFNNGSKQGRCTTLHRRTLEPAQAGAG
jgi:hypothetical protein